MPHQPVKFRKTEMRRALKAAREAGMAIERIEVTNDGVVILHTGKLEIASVEDAAKQAWTRATEELQTKPKTKPPKGKQVRR